MGWSQKVFFLKVVMLHIKLTEMKHRTTCKQIFCPYTHSRSLGGVDPCGGFKSFSVLKVVMVHMKIIGMKHRTPGKQILCPFTQPWTLELGSKVKAFFLKVVMMHIKLNGKSVEY